MEGRVNNLDLNNENKKGILKTLKKSIWLLTEKNMFANY